MNDNNSFWILAAHIGGIAYVVSLALFLIGLFFIIVRDEICKLFEQRKKHKKDAQQRKDDDHIFDVVEEARRVIEQDSEDR